MSSDNAHTDELSQELQISGQGTAAVVRLLDEGSTVPFIARYRKEAIGGLDEQQIIAIRDRLGLLRQRDKRRGAILKSLKEQKKLTDAMQRKISEASTLTELEDIYLPFRPKRKTRAAIAREKGLEPLAKRIFAQENFDPVTEARLYLNPQKGVDSVETALQYARDIIAERINEDADLRKRMRSLFSRKAILQSAAARGQKEKADKYQDYFSWSEPLARAPSHRVLAILRGAAEGLLSFHMLPDEETAIHLMEEHLLHNRKAAGQLCIAIRDCYKRLLAPSMETEMRVLAKKQADEAAVRVFVENLRQLLLAPPLGEKNTLAIDPGYRTGCKVVCLNRQGSLLEHTTIYPLEPHKKTEESATVIRNLCRSFSIKAIAIGNGTGGRDAQAFCDGLDLGPDIAVVMVNESGASVYSASEIARREFPKHDVTVRGSVSIGRRLMDPLAELVKIDPKSIGVGQYQHDVDQKLLKSSLDDVVASCVNAVGVEINTASCQLLCRVSGLSKRLADSIVTHRVQHGPFRTREEIARIPGLGPKTYQQAAGFLRIRDGVNPLDSSAVHPESYPLIEAMAVDLGASVGDLMKDASLRNRIDLERYATGQTGLPTLRDIIAELARPGRDPRPAFEGFRFAEGVREIEDLKPGMKLPGVVTNVTAFGAFVDVGVHHDGLVHISRMADRFVRDPNQIVKVQERVTVTVLEVDLQRGRIFLSLRESDGAEAVEKER